MAGSKGLGKRKINYKLRDWLFSRQRYWGEPFPILHEWMPTGNPTGVVEALRPNELPLKLPELEDFKPTGTPEPPLGKATEWVNVTTDGKHYKRETNTMPQWAGSCWYYLRYLDPRNDKAFCDPAKAKYWMPVDLYVGGAEHAVLHLLYCAVLAQGALRPRPRAHAGAVSEARQPGHDPRRDGVHRLPETAAWVGNPRRARSKRDVAVRGSGRGGQARRGAGREEGRRVRPQGGPEDPRRRARLQDVEEPWQRHQSGRVVERVRRRQHAAL